MTHEERKATPIYTGVLKYFPKAIAAIAQCSKVGNDQHHPEKLLHWDKSKSTDNRDALVRHLLDAGTVDHDGILHSTKVAWRALAALEVELEENTEVTCLMHPCCKEPAGHEKCTCCGKGIGGVCGACHCNLNRIKHTLTEYGDETCSEHFRGV